VRRVCAQALCRPQRHDCHVRAINFYHSTNLFRSLPMLMFFGTGILNKDDFNNFLWTVIMLAMGGTALGVAVRESKLLTTIATGIQAVLQGQSVWVAFTTFCALVLVAATFISHTVSALIILPIVQQVGQDVRYSHHSS
jgi:phosphate transporter